METSLTTDGPARPPHPRREQKDVRVFFPPSIKWPPSASILRHGCLSKRKISGKNYFNENSQPESIQHTIYIQPDPSKDPQSNAHVTSHFSNTSDFNFQLSQSFTDFVIQLQYEQRKHMLSCMINMADSGAIAYTSTMRLYDVSTRKFTKKVSVGGKYSLYIRLPDKVKHTQEKQFTLQPPTPQQVNGKTVQLCKVISVPIKDKKKPPPLLTKYLKTHPCWYAYGDQNPTIASMDEKLEWSIVGNLYLHVDSWDANKVKVKDQNTSSS